MRYVLIKLITAYQYLISPLLGNNCRFQPTCSAYAAEAIGRHGVPKGVYFAVIRILKCHPFHEGGNDPVPH